MLPDTRPGAIVTLNFVGIAKALFFAEQTRSAGTYFEYDFTAKRIDKDLLSPK
jgi:hypothetical protein